MEIRFRRSLIACAVLAGSLMAAGCSSGGGGDDPEPPQAPQPETPEPETPEPETPEPETPEPETPEPETPEPEAPGEPPAATTFEFGNAAYSVVEGNTSVTVQVNRTGSTGPASVAYAAVGGDATQDEDYRLEAGRLSWGDGQTGGRTFSIEILADEVMEAEETVELALSDPNGGSLGTVDAAVLTIQEPVNLECVELETTRISADTTLGQPCYLVNRDVEVSGGAILTILPGVELRFGAQRGFDVEADGQLIAEGTAEQPILFTGSLKAPGYWDGIEIASLATSSIKHVTVEYGGERNSFSPAGISLSFQGRAVIEDTTVRGSGLYGIAASTNTIIESFARNTITSNEAAPVRIDVNSLGRLDSDSRYTGNADASGASQDWILAEGSAIRTTQTWKALDVEYRFNDTRPNVHALLTIEPGVRLVFPSSGLFAIEAAGTLKAIGTEELPIVFTGRQATPGYWNGIQFSFNGNPNEMDHTIVEYGGGGGNAEANVGVFGQRGRLAIRNSILRHSSRYGFYFHSEVTLEMENVTTVDNAITGYMYLNDVGKLDPASQYADNTIARVNLQGDPLTRSQVMRNIGVPYRLLRTAPTPINATLTIEPGVELQFTASNGLRIDSAGALTARGTAEAPIVFTGVEKTKGFWDGIEFWSSSSDVNLIDHAVVEYAGSEGGIMSALVGFSGNGSRGTVSNTVLRASQFHGLALRGEVIVNYAEGNVFEDIDGEEVFNQP